MGRRLNALRARLGQRQGWEKTEQEASYLTEVWTPSSSLTHGWMKGYEFNTEWNLESLKRSHTVSFQVAHEIAGVSRCLDVSLANNNILLLETNLHNWRRRVESFAWSSCASYEL